MSAAIKSGGMRQLVWFRQGCSLPTRDLPITFYSFQLLGRSDTEEVKYRNARLQSGIVTLILFFYILTYIFNDKRAATDTYVSQTSWKGEFTSKGYLLFIYYLMINLAEAEW